jgi:hypothetical protein
MLENDDIWHDGAGKPSPESQATRAGSVSQSLRTVADAVSGRRGPAGHPRANSGWPWLRMLLVWLLLMAAVTTALAAYQYVSLLGELERQSNALQAEASRRADQHDAHVTALSAVAQAEQGPDYGLLLDGVPQR